MVDQNLTDPDELFKQLEELGIDSEDIPDEIDAAGEGDEEKKKKARHAYAQLKGMLRTARQYIEQQGEELKKVKSSGGSTTPTGHPNGNSQSSGQVSAEQYLSMLTMRACQRTGISDPEHKLNQLEIQRLYNEDLGMAERQVRAKKEAEKLFEEVTSSVPILKDEHKSEIRERMSNLSDLERADEEVVRREVNAYIGENFDKFRSSKGQSGGGKGGSDASAAVSETKARGGVRPGPSAPGSDEGDGDEPPATPDELREMRQLHIPVSDLAIYRRAKKKQGKYAQR